MIECAVLALILAIYWRPLLRALWWLALVALCWQLSQQAQAAPWWGTRDGWGHEAINGYGGDPCYAWSAEEHAWRYVCEKRGEKRKDEHK